MTLKFKFLSIIFHGLLHFHCNNVKPSTTLCKVFPFNKIRSYCIDWTQCSSRRNSFPSTKEETSSHGVTNFIGIICMQHRMFNKTKWMKWYIVREHFLCCVLRLLRICCLLRLKRVDATFPSHPTFSLTNNYLCNYCVYILNVLS